ncbi:MAG: nucleoside hydrolase [Thermoflexales bacterium]|nr:nucleoside hydrolase [Thermoflexales bacterium]MDW8351071.1 nucleoside hydrolase [Anaerolineae bacterium]
MRWIIDTDAGVDDAIGIGMLLALGPLRDQQVSAITTVSGNVHVSQVNVNVGAVLDVFGADVPIYAGCDRPMIEPRVHAEEFHGADGLGGAGLSKTSRRPQREHAAIAMSRLAEQHAGDIGLIALGPLTNVALASNLDPSLPDRIAKLVIMGGAWQARGNQTSAAEFNIAADPESAHVVFERFPNVIMLPWEVSLDQMMPFEVFERIRAGASPRARFFAAMTRVVYDWRDRFGFAGVPLPDPLAVAVALDEGVIVRELKARVKIDIGHSIGRGLSSLDYRHPQPNTRVVVAVDADRAWQMIERAWVS